MGRRTRWARAGIAAGSLLVVEAIIIFGHLFLPTGLARLLSFAATVGWALVLLVVLSVWYTRPDGSRRMGLPIAVIVLGTIGSIVMLNTAPEAMLARIGEPTRAVVVVETKDPRGGGRPYHYLVDDFDGRRLKGEVLRSQDDYDVGSELVVIADPARRLASDEIPIEGETRWLEVNRDFSIAALALSVIALALLLPVGYRAPGTVHARKIRLASGRAR